METIVNSSNIHKITWDKMIMTLYFYNESVIEYLEISLEETLKVCNAVSVGSYLHQNIKNNYSYRRIK